MDAKFGDTKLAGTRELTRARLNVKLIMANTAKDYTSLVREGARIVVSLLVLVGGFFVLSESCNDGTQKAAIGFMGAVIGYWLK